MKTYTVLIAAYLRGYSEIQITAPDDDSAVAQAIQEAKEAHNLSFSDFDDMNLVQPAVVHVMEEGKADSLCEGIDVAIDPQDSLEYAARDMLAALESIPLNCGHIYPHLTACWQCKAADAIKKAREAGQ